MCSFRSCQTRFEFLSQFRKVRNAFECFITQVQTRLPKTKCVWPMKINVICTVSEGIHGRILKLLRSMYSKFKSCVKTSGGLTEWFDCLIGTRQGCIVSPLLFILYINILVSMCNQSVPGIFLNMNVPSVQVLLYIDDIALVNDTAGMSQCSQYFLSELWLTCK